MSAEDPKLRLMYPQHLATKNQNKLREFSQILGVELQQIDIDLQEPQGLDVAEVVRQKAREAFERTGKFVLVEDTGLEFDAWNGLPGALVKWFLQSVGNEGILRMLEGETNRHATARTAIGFYNGQECQVFLGETRGSVPIGIRGSSGFGWDPIFIPEGYTQSFAEMSAVEKNAVSMRRIALEKMREHFTR